MTTMYETISRSKEKMIGIILNRKELFKDVIELFRKKEIKQIVFVGSGSSYSSVLSTMLMVEKFSGIETVCMLPNILINKSVYNNEALYIFVSQTGTSSLTLECAKKLKDLGYLTLAMTGDMNSPISVACEYQLLIDLGYEEYTYATLGFSCSMMTEMLMGLEAGLVKGHISEKEYEQYIGEALSAAENNAETILKTKGWFEKEKENLLKVENFIIFGGNTLQGIATEGALKIMEITKKNISIGYEMDDGLHGPNYCFDERTAVIALNDGKDNEKAVSLMNLMKKEYGTGYMFGINTMDEHDLKLDIKTDSFTNIEIISALQTLAYLLTVEIGTPIYEKKDPRINTTKGKGYFNMHLTK